MRVDAPVLLLLLTLTTTSSAMPISDVALVLEAVPQDPPIKRGGGGESGNGTDGGSQDGFECAQENAGIFVEWVRTHPGDPSLPDRTEDFVEEVRDCEPGDLDVVAFCQRKADTVDQWLVADSDYNLQSRWVTVTLPGIWYEQVGPVQAEDLMWHYILEFNKRASSECE